MHTLQRFLLEFALLGSGIWLAEHCGRGLLRTFLIISSTLILIFVGWVELYELIRKWTHSDDFAKLFFAVYIVIAGALAALSLRKRPDTTAAFARIVAAPSPFSAFLARVGALTLIVLFVALAGTLAVIFWPLQRELATPPVTAMQQRLDPANVPEAYPLIYRTTLRTFRSYVCTAMVNYFARNSEADMVTDAPQNTTPKEIIFMRPDRTPVCGKIIYKPSEPTVKNSYQDNINLYRLSQLHADAFDAIKGQIRDEATRVAKEFLPPNNVTHPEPHISYIEHLAENYQQYVENRLKSSSLGQGNALVQVMNIPDATGPNILLMTDIMLDASRAYSAYLDWEQKRCSVVHGALNPDIP